MKIWKIVLFSLGLGSFMNGECIIGNRTMTHNSSIATWVIGCCWVIGGFILMTPFVLNKNKGDEDGHSD